MGLRIALNLSILFAVFASSPQAVQANCADSLGELPQKSFGEFIVGVYTQVRQTAESKGWAGKTLQEALKDNQGNLDSVAALNPESTARISLILHSLKLEEPADLIGGKNYTFETLKADFYALMRKFILSDSIATSLAYVHSVDSKNTEDLHTDPVMILDAEVDKILKSILSAAEALEGEGKAPQGTKAQFEKLAESFINLNTKDGDRLFMAADRLNEFFVTKNGAGLAWVKARAARRAAFDSAWTDFDTRTKDFQPAAAPSQNVIPLAPEAVETGTDSGKSKVEIPKGGLLEDLGIDKDYGTNDPRRGPIRSGNVSRDPKTRDGVSQEFREKFAKEAAKAADREARMKAAGLNTTNRFAPKKPGAKKP